MKYSVIIPIYNAEKSIKRCLDSLLPQLNSDVEIILVNDGSTDTSGEICKEYAAKNRSFHYYEQTNSGVSVARNTGIEKATGEYIVFIDSDDYVSKDAFLQIDQVLSECEYDFIITPLLFTDKTSERKESMIPFFSKDMDAIFSKISDLICRKQINAPIGKVYRREIMNINHICFPEGCSIVEDKVFNIAYALHIQNLRVLDDSFYHYVVTSQDSLSRSVRSAEELNEQFDIGSKALDEALCSSNLEKKYLDRIREAENFCCCIQVYSRAKRMKLRKATKEEIFSGIRNDCKEVNKKKMHYPKTNYCRKIYMPVKLRQYWLIYKVAMKLAERAS